MKLRTPFAAMIASAGFGLLVLVSFLSPQEDLSGPIRRAAAGILAGSPSTPWLVFALLVGLACAAALVSFTYRGKLYSLDYALGLSVLFLCGPVHAGWLLVASHLIRAVHQRRFEPGAKTRDTLTELGGRPLMAMGAGLAYVLAGGAFPLEALRILPGFGDPGAGGWGPPLVAVISYFSIRELVHLPRKIVQEDYGFRFVFWDQAPELLVNGGLGVLLGLSFLEPGILPAIFRAGLILFACHMVREMVENREDLRLRVAEMRSLSMVGRAICSSMQPEDLMAVIYRECRRLLDPSLFYVALYDKESKSLRMDLVAEGDQVLEGLEIPPSQGFTGLVYRTHKPIIFGRRKDMESHPAWTEGEGIGSVRCESFLWVPISTRDRVYGVLCAMHKDPERYSPQTLQAVQAIAQQAGVALENINLFRKATTDGLTGLYLRSYFEQKLEEQLFKARRHGYRLSLMVIDLDNFKEINDTLGHAAGDEVLREVGQAIGHAIRSQDVAARYGGDEFVLMLPGIPIENCLDVAARIKRQVQALNFPVLARMGMSRITVSIGIATVAPGEQTDLTSLFETADQALYEAKRSGKNRVLHREQAAS